MSILTRALRLLEAYSHEQPELGITELSRALRLPKSTVHTNRVVAALGVSGPAHRLPRERLRELGLVTSEVGGQLSRALRDRP